ncbi:MAG: sugar phosphorylase [Anaerolineales bacterium]|nr:sugar phosphorylase [Anaerolineales bacterium]
MTGDPYLPLLTALYGAEAETVATRLRLSLALHPQPPQPPRSAGLPLSERDALLISYGDQLTRRAGDGSAAEPPLRTLAEFCAATLPGLVSSVHLLPFYPASSDDGFSVVDYRAVDPALGGWEDVARFRPRFRLMFDAVINHVSAQSAWFRAFLSGDPAFQNDFITVTGDPDLMRVVRPRALPLLTTFATPGGERRVWTTFSADQVDLNYQNPDVLLEIIDTLLFYVDQGASLLRLDAIAYLWKEIGTTCLHRPQTHAVIQLLRAVLDEAAPATLLVTETNVPHVDNVSYFGDGANEAQLVYNFALPPLTLHAFHTGRAEALSAWAATLERPTNQVTFFNFLASHDGIGLNPARGLLPEAEIDALVAHAQAQGGHVSYKTNADGTASPYELNINYFDALSDSAAGEPLGTAMDRFVCAHAIMFALAGVPGIYFHSLFGSRGWPEGLALTGRSRTINRQKLDLEPFAAELAAPGRRRAVFERLAHLLRLRAAHSAFHPLGRQQVVAAGPGVFALRRAAPDGSAPIVCLHNVSAAPQVARLDSVALEWPETAARDLIDGHVTFGDNSGLGVGLAAYQAAWLAPTRG